MSLAKDCFDLCLAIVIAVDCFLQRGIGCSLGFALQHSRFETQSYALGEYHAAFDHVLQFTNVSRPRILLHRFQRTLLDLANLLSHARRQPRREIIYQQRNIINAFAQRRNLNREDIQPIKKVHAKSTVVNFPFKIFVASCDDANVRLDRSVSPDAFKLSFLQHPQESHLYLRAQLCNLVKKDRAAVGRFEPADPLMQRAGESSFLVPEQFAGNRSEEHTSELQSLRHLVCRLLLEKKKTHRPNTSSQTVGK